MPSTPPDSAQGSTVSFNGSPIGKLRGWRFTPRSAVLENVTGDAATLLGTGDETRVVKQFECLAVDPGSADVTLYGVAFSKDDVGSKGDLVFTFTGGSLTLEAVLENYEGSGQVGGFIEGSATFRFTGG